MGFFTKYVNFIKYSHFLAMLGTALLIFVCAPGIQKLEDTGSNMVSVFINGTQVGTVKDASEVDGMILKQDAGSLPKTAISCSLIRKSCFRVRRTLSGRLMTGRLLLTIFIMFFPKV